MANDLEKEIIRQVEYYFSDINLPTDKFLQEKIKEDEDGWVTLETLLTLKTLSDLSKDAKVIAEALEKSENKLVWLNEDKSKVKRNPEKPLPENIKHIKKLEAGSEIMPSDLEKKIIHQVEYYFGDINLPSDKSLQEKIKEDEDGWVKLETLLTFKTLADLSKDAKVIAEALEKSENKLVWLNEDKSKVKRNPKKPLPEDNKEHIKKLQIKSETMPSESDLEKKIIRQVEYYFGDINLPRDKFLQEKIKEDEDGWVKLETLLTFRRLADLSKDAKVIAEALEKSENKLVWLNEDKSKVKRNPKKPLPKNNEEHIKQLQTRSAYVKGFPKDSELNDIITFMEQYGPAESVIRRTEKDHKFKGSCFIVFKDVETAKKFVELESVKYKDTELVRKMQQDYHADKKKEIEERKRLQKEKKQQAIVMENAVKIEFPSGAVIHFSGISEGQELTREEIKEKVNETSGFEVVYIDFNKGDLEGYVRFSKENNAVDFFKKLTDGILELGDNKLKIKALEGDEEKEYLKKTLEAMVTQRHKQKHSGRKRKGNFGGSRNAKHSKKH